MLCSLNPQKLGRLTVQIGKNLAYEDEQTIGVRLSYDSLEAGWHRAAIRRSVAPLLRDEAEDFRFRQGSFEPCRAALRGRKPLELQGQERLEARLLVIRGGVHAGGDGLAKLRKCFVIVGIQALGFDEFPQTFNQVEIRRIGGEKEELNVELGRLFQDEGVALIADIIQDDGNGKMAKLFGHLLQ